MLTHTSLHIKNQYQGIIIFKKQYYNKYLPCMPWNKHLTTEPDRKAFFQNEEHANHDQ